MVYRGYRSRFEEMLAHATHDHVASTAPDRRQPRKKAAKAGDKRAAKKFPRTDWKKVAAIFDENELEQMKDSIEKYKKAEDQEFALCKAQVETDAAVRAELAEKAAAEAAAAERKAAADKEAAAEAQRVADEAAQRAEAAAGEA